MLANLPSSLHLLHRPLLPLAARLRRTMTTLAATGRENMPSSSEPAAKVHRTEVAEELRVRRLNEHALLPKRGSTGAAGYDLAR